MLGLLTLLVTPAPIGPVVQVVFVLVILGVALFLLERYVPMDEPIKIVIRVVVVLALVWWLLRTFGLL